MKVEHLDALQIIDTVSVLLPVVNGCLTIFHKSVKDWLVDEELAEDLVVNPLTGHSDIALLCYTEFMKLKMNIVTTDELVSKPIHKYAIDNLVYHLSNTSGNCDDVMKLCKIVTDLQYMYYRLHASQLSAKDLLDDFTEAKKLVPVKTDSYKKLELSKNFLHRHAHVVGTSPHLIFQRALNEPQAISMQLGIQNYIDNPGIKFPGLHMYLELINKPQNVTPAVIEYHCIDNVMNFDLSLDGKILACVDGGKVYVWNKPTGELLCDLSKKDQYACSISPNGKEILLGDVTEVMGADGSITPLFETDDGNTDVCIFSPNGKYILGWISCGDRLLRLLAEMQVSVEFHLQVWYRDLGTSKLLERTSKREIRPLCACFSHDSGSILCGHKDGWIIIWESESGKPKAMLSTDGAAIKSRPFKRSQSLRSDPVYDIAYSQNGHFIAACYSDGILIWDAAAFKLIQKIQPSQELLSAQTDITYTGCSFSRDSQYLVAGLSNGYVNTWINQTADMKPFCLQLTTNLLGSPDAVNQCIFDNDKNLICSVNNVIGLYDYQSLQGNPMPEQIACCSSTFCHFMRVSFRWTGSINKWQWYYMCLECYTWYLHC